MTVVLNAGGGGVLFHEACGHGLEADAIAKDTTVFAKRKGDRVGSAIFNGIDDATVTNGWGQLRLRRRGDAGAAHGAVRGRRADRRDERPDQRR
jgi:TldD protein